MLKRVRCGSYFDFMLHMNSVSPQIFYGGVPDCISLICEITSMREWLKSSWTDFMSINNDSVIFVCFNCLKDQIFITNQERFVDSFLETEYFNFKMKAHILYQRHACPLYQHHVCRSFDLTWNLLWVFDSMLQTFLV